MINRLKKPRNVALLTLGLAIISVIYSIVQGIRFPEYFEYTIYEILIMTSLSTAIYFVLILLGRNINVKKIRIEHPCIIMAATDGCFGYLKSPMEFEKLLLDTLLAGESIVQWQNALY